MKKQGFTLAEVLITLVIIGIIAAMTLPSLLGGTNKQEIKTGLQKSISVLTQAITLQYALTGDDFSTLSSGSTTTVDAFAKSRLNLKKIDGSNYTTQDGIIYNLSGITSSCNSTNPCQITVDVNGGKAPNELTADSAAKLSDIKDQFTLYVYGTTVTAAMQVCTTEENNGVGVQNCTLSDNSAAIKFLDDKIAN